MRADIARQTKQQVAILSTTVLSLAVTLRCHVYNDSLLGRGEQPTMAGAGTIGHSGSAGSAPADAERGGVAGKSAADGGDANASFGGFIEMAGALEAGGSEASGGTVGASGNGPLSGMAGAIGGAGAAGGGSGAGGSGAGGSGAGGSGVNQTATGCAKLSVPLNDTGDKAHFVISLASATDLSAATISMRFYVQAGLGGTIFNYVQDSGTYHFLGVPEANRKALSSASGWSTISWNVGAEPDSAGTGIVKTSIKSIGVEINAQPSSKWSDPTIVYVDSVTVQSPALAFNFDAANSVSTSNTSGALWLNGGSLDTTASGSALSWQATCP